MNNRCKALTAVVLAMATLAACVPASARKPADGVSDGKPQTGLRTVTLRSGSVEVLAELAMTDAEMQKGLMYRKELADGRGMLFVYKEDRKLSFWMKNTLIPLSIAYIGSDGVIKDIRDMEPLSLASVESSRYVRYALEAPLGFYARAGLEPGDRFDIPEVLAALED